MFRILVLLTAALPLLGFNTSLYQKVWTENHQDPIDPLFDRLFISAIENAPQTLSHLRIFEKLGLHEHNGELNDVSPKTIIRDFNRAKETLAQLEAFPLDDLSEDQKTSVQTLRWLLENEVDGEKFLFHEYKVNQLFSVFSSLTLLFTQFHPLDRPEDVDLYVARLMKIPRQINQTIKLMDYQKSLGIVPPAFAMEKVIQILQKSLPESIYDHPFYTHLKSHTNDEKQLAGAADAMKRQVYPAVNQFLEYCKTFKSKDNLGAWSLPDGDAYYQYQLRYHTSTDLTADEIHALGLKEVERIQGQMRAILASIGIDDETKSVGELMQVMAEDRQFYYPNTEEGRKECLAGYEEILERCRRDLYPLFDLKPSNPVQILPVPKHEEVGAPAAYYMEPSLDRTRPGLFFANLGNLNEVPKYQMETLTIHEAEPGHHFQISLQQEMDIPMLRKFGFGASCNAYVEGWALYVEKLGFEEGFYSTPQSQLGHLQLDLMRAVRLVVDTGIHKMRWSREEAIDYMQRVTGNHIGNVTTEIERYFVMPGQACSYKIGQLKILELREKAKLALGADFDIREFHNAVLKTAAAPLTILEAKVDAYISDSRCPVPS